MKYVDGVPRRARVDLATPAENAIRAAMRAVEEAGASVELTEAVVFLDRALGKVADHVEKE